MKPCCLSFLSTFTAKRKNSSPKEMHFILHKVRALIFYNNFLERALNLVSTELRVANLGFIDDSFNINPQLTPWPNPK